MIKNKKTTTACTRNGMQHITGLKAAARTLSLALAVVLTPLIWTSCKTKSAVVSDSSAPTHKAARDREVLANNQLAFMRRVNGNQVYAKNIVGSISLNVQGAGKDVTVPGQLRMRKDEVIRLQAFVPLLGTEVGRIEFTPDYVLVIDRIHKEYIKADYNQMDFLRKNGLNFYSLQALFWNELLLPDRPRITESDLNQFSVTFSGGSSNPITYSTGNFNYAWLADADNGRLRQTDITHQDPTRGTTKLTWKYGDFKGVGVKMFPTSQVFSMSSAAVKGGQALQVTIKMNEVKTDEKWDAQTTVSPKYKRVKAQDVFNKILNM